MRNLTTNFCYLISLCAILLTTAPAKAHRDFLSLSSDKGTSLMTSAYMVTNASIGNWVWEDMDYDGVQDVGEPGLPNVTMLLYRDNDANNTPDGAPVATTQTATNGTYQFLFLDAGNYIVECVIPNGFFLTTQNGMGSRFSPSTHRTLTINLVEGESDITNDAGLVRLGNISGKAWDDLNANKQSEFNEPGLAGVSLLLYADADYNAATFDGLPVATTVTNYYGDYSFQGLTPGRYHVRLVPFADYILDSQFGPGYSNDFNPATNGTNIQTIVSGQSATNIDAGLYRNGSIGDQVWDDMNQNGIQDTGEPGIANVVLRLYFDTNGNGTPGGPAIATTTTNAYGQYQFNSLQPFDYIVEVIPPANYHPSPPNMDANDQTDSDININTSRTGTFPLQSGQNITNIDAGFVPLNANNWALGGRIWIDSNYNGHSESPAEQSVGFAGILLFSDNNLDGLPDGSAIDTAISTPNGNYTFIVPPGSYIIQPDHPESLHFTQKVNDIPNDYNDSDADSEGRISIIITDNHSFNNDIGIFNYATLRGTAWIDSNYNGKQNTSETGLSGVAVHLFHDNNGDGLPEEPAITDTTTNISGDYVFNQLTPGTYIVKMYPPAGYRFTLVLNAVVGDPTDSDFFATTHLSLPVVLSSGVVDSSTDGGFILDSTAIFQLRVWHDRNNNGTRSFDEEYMNNIPVAVYADFNQDSIPDDQPLSLQNSENFVFFASDGHYIVQFSLPAPWQFIQEPQSGNYSNPNAQRQIFLEANFAQHPGFYHEFGIFKPVTIGGKVFEDLQNNGILNFGDPVMSDINIQLGLDNNQNGVIDSVIMETTPTLGRFTFPNLPPSASYALQFSKPANWWYGRRNNTSSLDYGDSDVNGSGFVAVQALSGQADSSIFAGYYRRAGMSGVIWNDLNYNGLMESGEPPLSNILISVFRDNNADGVADSASVAAITTNGTGVWSASNLQPGYYFVQMSLPAGYINVPCAGAPLHVSGQNDFNPGEHKTSNILLLSGAHFDNIDGGLTQEGRIGDTIFIDADGDGQFDSSEGGIQGASLKIFADANQDGIPDGGALHSIQSGTNGLYLFTVTPGSYLLNVTPPSAYQLSSSLTDSQGYTTPITVTGGAYYNQYDIGLKYCNGFITAIPTAPDCQQNNGEIAVTLNAVGNNYSVIWNDGFTEKDRHQITAGIYTVTVTADNGCTYTQAVALNELNAPNIILSAQPSCFGQATGAVTSVISNGTAPYNFNWNTGSTAQNLSQAPQGQYSLTVTDQQNCRGFDMIHVAELSPITIHANITNYQCQATDIILTSSGGMIPYTYQWNNGSTKTIRYNLGEGIYTVTVRDANQCTSTASFNIEQTPVWEVLSQVSATHCSSSADGHIELSVIGNSAPATYQWADGATTAHRTQLAPGTYCVTITVPGECRRTACYEITAPPVMTAAIERLNSSCDPTATLQATAEGGNTPYSFDWSYTAESPDPSTIYNLPPGAYTVTVTDASGCSVQTSWHFSHISELEAIITPSSCNEATGSIELTAPQGIQFTQYAWANGATANPLSALENGLYTVTITDMSGCTASKTLTVLNANGPQFNITTTAIPCDGSTQGGASIVPVGTPVGLTYLWSNAYTLPDQSNLPYGSYTVTVTQSDGCTNAAPVFIGTESNCLAGLQIAYQLNGNLLTGNEFLKIWTPNEPITLDILLTNTGNMRLFDTQVSNPQLATPCIIPMLLPGTTQSCQVQWVPQPGITPVISAISAKPLNGAGIITGIPLQLTDTFTLRNAALRLTVEAQPVSLCSSAQVIYTIRLSVENGPLGLRYTSISGITTGGASWPFTPYGMGWVGSDLNNDGNLNSYDADNDGISEEVFTWKFYRTPVHSDTIYFSVNGAFYKTDAHGDTYIQDAGVNAMVPLLIGDEFCSSWSGFAWEDSNLDGIWQPNEGKISNTSLQLYHITGNVAVPFASQITDANGAFSFDYLEAGTYRLGILPPGDYLLHTLVSNGLSFSNQLSQDKVISAGEDFHTPLGCTHGGYIQGTVRGDVNGDCSLSLSAPELPGRALQITSASREFYAWADTSGHYQIAVPPDNYIIKAVSPVPELEFCQQNQSIAVGIGGSYTVDFWEKIHPCPMLEVNMIGNDLRRCDYESYWISYQNHSPFEAENVSVEIQLDDHLTLIDMTLNYTALGNNRFLVQLGTLPALSSGAFHISVHVACNSLLGSFLCSEAVIQSAENNCFVTHPEWSGAILEVRSQCATDSLRFHLRNSGSGTMSQNLEYIVIEDGIMSMPHITDPLPPGQEVVIAVPANGSTWSVEAGQEPFAPSQYSPTLSVEGCTSTGSFSTGWMAQFPEYDAGRHYDHDCELVTGSYDPNDKRGYPEGYGTQHYIAPQTPLTYTIRFQNTGNDTAFTVIIADTLSPLLNPASIRPLGASHPYTFDLIGTGIAVFRFDSIMLPDSIVNEPASHGFVRYSIIPKSDTPLESDILNQAAIYFDYNAPIFTNTTTHRIGDHFIVSGVRNPVQPIYSVEVSPNPATLSAAIRLTGCTETGLHTCTLYNSQGRIMQRINSPTASFKVSVADWPEGAYWFDIQCEGKFSGKGKLFVR